MICRFQGGATGANGGSCMSPFEAFVFSEKSFCQIRDIKWPKMAQNCIIIYAHVPFWVILILNLNVLPKSGHAILRAFS